LTGWKVAMNVSKRMKSRIKGPLPEGTIEYRETGGVGEVSMIFPTSGSVTPLALLAYVTASMKNGLCQGGPNEFFGKFSQRDPESPVGSLKLR